MDMAIVISIMILAFIVILEIFILFRQRSENEDITDFIAVVPVFPEDNDLKLRLDILSEKIATGRLMHIENIILIDYGATREQLEICKRFSLENPLAIMAIPEDFQKILSETFAISRIK